MKYVTFTSTFSSYYEGQEIPSDEITMKVKSFNSLESATANAEAQIKFYVVLPYKNLNFIE
jgi:hypothetical protein